MMRFNTMCKCCRAYKNYTKKGINEKIYLIGFHIIIVERKAHALGDPRAQIIESPCSVLLCVSFITPEQPLKHDRNPFVHPALK